MDYAEAMARRFNRAKWGDHPRNLNISGQLEKVDWNGKASTWAPPARFLRVYGRRLRQSSAQGMAT
jgi:hypothetical protein